MVTRACCCFLFSIFFSPLFVAAQDNPTGTYTANTIKDEKAEHQEGNTGEIRVKRLSPSKIAVAVFVVTWPWGSYGDFVDTLTLKGNEAVYTVKIKDTTSFACDSTCRISFIFKGSRLIIKQTSEESRFPCGFGERADISGVYRRVSTKVPVIRDLTRDEAEGRGHQ
jgi:hypothetical protein